MATFTEVRIEIEAALRAAGLPAFASMPATVAPPAVVINPDQPWITPYGLGGKGVYTVNFRISVMAPALDTEGSTTYLEELVEDTLDALPSGVDVHNVSSPRLESLSNSQGSAYAADIYATVNAKKG